MIAERSERDSISSAVRPPEPSHAQQSAAFRRELVRRVVLSPTFARSERLGTLLTFICDMALQGRDAEINEQKIGQEVFGRTQYYDSTVDGIVRTQASRLRQRLEAYFAGEGANEPIRIVIPRGGYVPVFDAHNLPVSPPNTGSAEELQLDGAGQSTRASSMTSGALYEPGHHGVSPWKLKVWIGSLALCSILLLCLCIYQRIQIRAHTSQAESESKLVGVFWAQLFPVGERNLIVPGDSSLVFFENLTKKQVDLSQYVSKKYLAEDSTDRPDSEIEIAKRVGTKRLTSLADTEFVAHMLSLPEIAATHPKIRFARDLEEVDLKEANLVFLGAPEAVPWLSLFQPGMNFVLSNDQKTTVFTVRNRSPKTNEPGSFQYDPRVSGSEAYAVISYRPNLNGQGNVLIMEGTGIAGLEAAVGFLSDDSRFEQVLRPIYQNGKLAGHFEVLLQTAPLNGTAPRTEVVSVRYSP